MLLLAHFISAFRHKMEHDIMSKVGLLVLSCISRGEEDAVASRRSLRHLCRPVTRKVQNTIAPTVRATRDWGHIHSMRSHLYIR